MVNSSSPLGCLAPTTGSQSAGNERLKYQPKERGCKEMQRKKLRNNLFAFRCHGKADVQSTQPIVDPIF